MKLQLMLMHAKAITMLAPADVTINVVARQGNHQSRHLLKLSIMPSSASAIFGVIASRSFHRCPLKLPWLPLMPLIIEPSISVQFNDLQRYLKNLAVSLLVSA